jgi:hypothetical protein
MFLLLLLRENVYSNIVGCRVVDPYSFFTDPDPDPELDGGGQYGF